GEIANGGHDLGACATADARAIFIKGDVANVVETVFNTPVFAAGIQQARGVGAYGFEAGDPIDGFRGELVADQVRGFTPNGIHLVGMREIQILVQVRAGPELAY